MRLVSLFDVFSIILMIWMLNCICHKAIKNQKSKNKCFKNDYLLKSLWLVLSCSWLYKCGTSFFFHNLSQNSAELNTCPVQVFKHLIFNYFFYKYFLNSGLPVLWWCGHCSEIVQESRFIGTFRRTKQGRCSSGCHGKQGLPFLWRENYI